MPNVLATAINRAAKASAGGWADWQIQDEMACTGGDLFGKDRGDQLPLGIQIQHPLDPDQEIIRRAEVDGATPDNAAALLLHHTADGAQVEVDRCQRLHRVGSTCGRGDRAR